MLFVDRDDAGKKLAEKMSSYRWDNPLFLAVPRGGVIIARHLREYIGGEMDIIITRKIGAPGQEELAIGAVSVDGKIVLNQHLINRLKISPNYIDYKAEQEKHEIQRRLKAYRGTLPLPEITGRQIVIVDDGVATGATLFAVIESLQQKEPKELMVAVPVGPPDTLRRLAKKTTKVFYIDAPAGFASVGQYYRKFTQITDQEVISVLQELWL